MPNQIVVTGATLHKGRTFVSLVDMKLVSQSQENGALIELTKKGAVRRSIFDQQIVGLGALEDFGLFLLTKFAMFFVPLDGDEKSRRAVLQAEETGIFKKFFLFRSSIYVVTILDLVIRVDFPSEEKSIVIKDPIDSIEGIFADDRGELFVGWNGFMAERREGEWIEIPSATNSILTSVVRGSDDTFYAVGKRGVLVESRAQSAVTIHHDWEGLDFWDIVRFAGRTYIMGESGVFLFTGEKVVQPIIGRPQEQSIFFKFSSENNSLLAIGERNLLKLQEESWIDLLNLN